MSGKGLKSSPGRWIPAGKGESICHEGRNSRKTGIQSRDEGTHDCVERPGFALQVARSPKDFLKY